MTDNTYRKFGFSRRDLLKSIGTGVVGRTTMEGRAQMSGESVESNWCEENNKGTTVSGCTTDSLSNIAQKSDTFFNNQHSPTHGPSYNDLTETFGDPCGSNKVVICHPPHGSDGGDGTSTSDSTGNGGTGNDEGDTQNGERNGETSTSDATTSVPWTIIGGGIGGLLALVGVAKFVLSSETDTETDADGSEGTETREQEPHKQESEPETSSEKQAGNEAEVTQDADEDAVAPSQNTNIEQAEDKEEAIETTYQEFDAEFEDFEKVDLIGTGGNADVHRARITVDGKEQTVALKTPRMHNYETVDTSFFDEFVREAETWSKIDDHENIVSVLDWGRKPHPWIALEHMDAGSLKGKNMSFDRSVGTMSKVADAVQYAHRHGVSHSDLKPENILFKTENGREVVKVADWGLAKVLLDHSQSTEGLSPAYSAPEQFEDESRDAEDYQLIDIYQLGAVAYEVFTGKPPFEGSVAIMVNKIINEDPEPPSSVNPSLPKEVDDVVMKAMAKNPQNRFETAVSFRNALQELNQKER